MAGAGRRGGGRSTSRLLRQVGPGLELGGDLPLQDRRPPLLWSLRAGTMGPCRQISRYTEHKEHPTSRVSIHSERLDTFISITCLWCWGFSTGFLYDIITLVLQIIVLSDLLDGLLLN